MQRISDVVRDAGPHFRSDWNHCRHRTLVPVERAILAYQAVLRVDKLGIPGAIVEAGVWKGGMSCLMARAHLRAAARIDRTSWLFDTFDGMPAPDPQHDGIKAVQQYKEAVNGTSQGFGCRVEAGKWCLGRYSEVEDLMKTQSPNMQLRLVQGKVEDTLGGGPSELPEQIAVLRLDTDWFESTKIELDVLWPRLSPGGWLYIDDYYDFAGCRRAVHEWAMQHNYSTSVGFGRDGRHNVRVFHLFKSNPFEGQRAPFVTRNPLMFNDTDSQPMLVAPRRR